MIGTFLTSWMVAAASAADDGHRDRWPGFRGLGDSHVAEQDLPLEWSATKNLAWRVELPGYGQSSPVVWDGRVFTTSVLGANKETLVIDAFDLETGELAWEKRLPASETREYTETQSRASPTPVVDARALYAFFESGDLFAVDHDGTMRWHREIVRDYGAFQGAHGIGSSLAQTGDTVFVLIQHGGPSYLLAIDKTDGRTRYKVDRPEKAAWTTPIVSRSNGRDEILVSANGTVAAIDAASGAEIWQVTGVPRNLISSPSATEKVVVVGAMEKAGTMAIARDGRGDVTGSHVLWIADATADYASPLVTDGCVYFVNQTGGLTCVDPKTGGTLWRHRLPGEAWASPVLLGHRVYVFTKSGTTVVLEDRADRASEGRDRHHRGRRGRRCSLRCCDRGLLDPDAHVHDARLCPPSPRPGRALGEIACTIRTRNRDLASASCPPAL